MIYIIRSHATPQQIAEMLGALGDYVKLAVDVERDVLAGGRQYARRLWVDAA